MKQSPPDSGLFSCRHGTSPKLLNRFRIQKISDDLVKIDHRYGFCDVSIAPAVSNFLLIAFHGESCDRDDRDIA
jgi:hypothetical protein